MQSQGGEVGTGLKTALETPVQAELAGQLYVIPRWKVLLAVVVVVSLVILLVVTLSNAKGGGPAPPSDNQPPPPTQFPIEPGFEHMILYGQSLSNGWKGLPIASTSQAHPKNVFTLGDGPRAIGTDLGPLVEKADGSRGESPASALGNAYFGHYLRKTPDAKVLVTAPGEGGTSLAELTDEKRFAKFRAASANGAAAMKAADGNVSSPVTFWVQGEKDGKSGNKNYASQFKSLASKIHAVTKENYGKECQIVSYQTSAHSANNGVVQMEQYELHEEGVISIATPIYFMPHDKDDIHLSTRGSQILGAYFARAAFCIKRGERPPIVWPKKAERKGDEVHITFDVPVPPLRLISSPADNFGFTVSGGIKSAEVKNATVVVLTLNKAPSSPVQVSYAMGPKKVLTDSGTGGLVDSCTEKVSIGDSGDDVTLVNYCPHFELDSD